MKGESFVPRYKRVYEELAARIRSGKYAAGEKLPFERELCTEFSVERVTIRHALELLGNAGLIQKRPGIGSFVSTDKAAQAQNAHTIVFAMHRNKNDIRHNTNAFNSMLFFLMEQVCRQMGITLLYTSVQDSDKGITALEEQPVLGVVLISSHSDAILGGILSDGIPVVCVNHCDPRVISILPDNITGLRAAVTRLAGWGHTRVGFINGMSGAVNASERLSGFRYGLWDNGLAFEEDLIVEGDWTYEGGLDAMLRLMSAPNRPTAVIAASDMMAIGALEAARQNGLSVPRDVSVIGFDNIDMGSYSTPSIATVGVDARQIAVLAVEALLSVAGKPPREVDRYVLRVPSWLIERDSAGPAPGR